MSGNETVKSLIRELLAQGYTLSQVQTVYLNQKTLI